MSIVSEAVAESAAPTQLSSSEIVLPDGVVRFIAIEGITEYRLENGLRVLLLPDASKQTTTVNVTYLVGSRHESYGETGMAHLLEHLMFKGSKGHPNVMQELTDHGARPNGTTWYDRTNYFETFSSSDTNLEWALDLEADRMVNSFISADDLEREKGVVSNELMAGENDPSRVLSDRIMSAAYLWHNYGKSTIGALSDVNGYTHDRIMAFYRTYYQPDNAVLMVAGNFDAEQTLGMINDKFGSIVPPDRVIPTTYTQEPTQDGERTVTLRRAGDVAEVGAAYHVPAGSHPDAPAIDVLSRILGDAPSGRLYKALIEPRLASSASGYHYSLHDPGVLTFDASIPDSANVVQVRETLLATVEAMAGSAKPTEEEVERAKNQILKQIDLQLNSSERIGLGISTYVAMGDWRLLFLRRDRLRAVTVDDVVRVAAAYLKTDNRTVGTFIPTAESDRAEIPATEDLHEALASYVGAETVSEGEVFDASAENIESRTERLTVGGLQLTLLPKQTRGATVHACLSLHLGSLETLRGRRTAGTFVASMLSRGTAKHTRQELRDAFDRLQANVQISGGPTEVTATIETTEPNLAETIALAAEVLREPIFPEEEFELLRQERIAGLQENRSDPYYVAYTAATRYMLPYEPEDVRYSPGPDEAIELLNAVTCAQVKSFYESFYGASAGEFSAVGDFDSGEIASLLGNLFNDWTNPTPYSRVPRPYLDLPGTTQTFQTPDKSNAVTTAVLSMPVNDTADDYAALVIADDILGGGFLSSRLAVRIRQQESLSYGIGSRLTGSPFEPNSTEFIYGIYSPDNAGKFKSALFEEVERLLKDGVTESEVTAAATAYVQSEQVSRSQDRELTGRLAYRTYTGRTLAFDADFEARILALTPADVDAALRKYVDPKRIAYFAAGDFEGAKEG